MSLSTGGSLRVASVQVVSVGIRPMASVALELLDHRT